MASKVVGSWGYTDDCDDSSKAEFSQIDHNLLMALLDETQIDDCDDERLKKVIRSLEDEINSADCYEFDEMMWETDPMDYQSSNEESNSQDRSIKPNDVDDLCWADVEIMPNPPSCGMDNWSMEHHGQGVVGGVDEFDWVKNYALISSEDQDYGSLWHEANVTKLL